MASYVCRIFFGIPFQAKSSEQVHQVPLETVFFGHLNSVNLLKHAHNHRVSAQDVAAT